MIGLPFKCPKTGKPVNSRCNVDDVEMLRQFRAANPDNGREAICGEAPCPHCSEWHHYTTDDLIAGVS